MSFNKNTFAVIGQGYVGLPLAIAAAEAGVSTIGVDLDTKKVEFINSGNSPIDDITNKQVRVALDKKLFHATTDITEISNTEFISICVPTPIDENGAPDNSYLISALEKVGEYLSADAVVIIESTIAPGTSRDIALPILQKKSGGKNFGLVFSPERIDPANKNWDVTNTPKLVAGLTDDDLSRTLKFYSQFISNLVPGTSLEAIESAKLLENTFRLINISFINEFAMFCQKMGLDVREVIKAAGTKPYGFMEFWPSAGVGGHCIPVDPAYLAHKAKGDWCADNIY